MEKNTNNYNKEQSKAYALIAFYNWKNSANRNDRSLRNFEIFLEPLYKLYSKNEVIEVKNKIIKNSDKCDIWVVIINIKKYKYGFTMEG